MKKFFCICPFQKKGSLNPHIYEPVDNDKLKYERPVCYPIIPVINGYAEDNEEIEVIFAYSEAREDDVVTKENIRYNTDLFKDDLARVGEKKGLKINDVYVNVPYGEDIEKLLDMFGKLIDHMADNDTLFADITFGTKPMSQMLSVALNYGYRIHENVCMGCIVYGKINRGKEPSQDTAEIYDMSSMVYLDEIIRMFAEYKVPNPTENIKNLLNEGDGYGS